MNVELSLDNNAMLHRLFFFTLPLLSYAPPLFFSKSADKHEIKKYKQVVDAHLMKLVSCVGQSDMGNVLGCEL